MKDLYDEIASLPLEGEPLRPEQRQRILAQAMAGVESDTPRRKRPIRLAWRLAAVAVLLVCLGIGGVSAAGYFLHPDQVAREMEQPDLAELFTGPDSIQIGQTQQTPDYTVSLLGITTGQNVTGYWSSDWEGEAVQPERSYAVLAVRHTDGTPMAPLSDENGDLTLYNTLVSPVLASPDCPLMEYNIFTMNGSRRDLVADGVRYILVETDTLEPFADQNPQLAVVLDTFSDIATLSNGYNQDPATGAITPNEAAEGIHLLFDLPLDPAKADPEQAQTLREQWFGKPEDPAAPEEEEAVQTLRNRTPEEVRSQGTLQSSENVTVTQGRYGTGWYFGQEAFWAYRDGWDQEEDIVFLTTSEGQVVLLTHHDDDSLTVETWQVPTE